MSDGKVVKLKDGKAPEHRTEIRGGRDKRNDTTIVGASPAHGKTEILDQRGKAEPVVADVHEHAGYVTGVEDIRRANLQEGQADVRVHVISDEDKDEWKKVKEEGR